MAKKIQIKEIDLRNRVYSFVKLNPGMPDSSVVKHFMLEGFARSTLYDILKRKANNLDAERKIGSGRPAKKMTKIAVKRLKSRIDHSHGNEDVYIQHCLKARLVPFIKRVHADDEIVFWPDLASSHYSKKVLAYLKSENIDIVPKAINPANAPEVRPIEDFWTEIKRIVYDGAWEANNLEQLRNRINYAFKKVDMKRVHALGNASFTRVDTVRRHGLQNL